MDTLSFLFIIFLNTANGFVIDTFFKKIFNNYIPVFSIFSIGILSFLLYVNVEFLFLLNIFFNALFLNFILLLLCIEYIENVFIQYDAVTITMFIINNLKIIFLKLCERGFLQETKIIVFFHNIIKQYTELSVLCIHTFQNAIVNSSLNNHPDILNFLLQNFDISNYSEFFKKLINHVSRLGYFEIFNILVDKSNIKILDFDFYEMHSIKIKIDEASNCLESDYNKAIEILEIEKSNQSSDEKCMLCHDTHDKIIMLNCNHHYICLNSLFSYYKQHLSEELVCFICRKNVDFRKCVSFSK